MTTMLDDLKIRRDSGKPVSEQIAAYVKNKIYRREIRPGAKLPTTHEIMEQFGVGTHTVRQAMQVLKAEGLVRPVPRLGTIVNDLAEIEITDPEAPRFNAERVIAVSGLIQTVDENMRFRSDTAQGIVSECERLGVSLFVLPFSVAGKSGEQLYRKLATFHCQGLIYLIGSLADEDIDYLTARGIEAITSRRFRFKDNRSCIESDFDGAGYEVGLYYCQSACAKVSIFSHYELTCTHWEAVQNGYTLGLKQGIYRAFESQGVVPDIDFHVNKSETDPETYKNILARLKTLSAQTGVVFTHGYQFLNLLKRYHQEALQCLADKKVTVISNRTINYEMEKYVDDLEFMVLMDPFEEIGRKMVSMLVGMLEGYLPKNSTTLADIQFVQFQEALNDGIA